jgi:hypothetical protein
MLPLQADGLGGDTEVNHWVSMYHLPIHIWTKKYHKNNMVMQDLHLQTTVHIHPNKRREVR